jgi:hypothetical protein
MRVNQVVYPYTPLTARYAITRIGISSNIAWLSDSNSSTRHSTVTSHQDSAMDINRGQGCTAVAWLAQVETILTIERVARWISVSFTHSLGP